MATDVSLTTDLATNVTMGNSTDYMNYTYSSVTMATVMTSDEYNMQRRLRDFVSEPQKCIALALGCIAITLNVFSLLAISQIKNRITNHYRLIISLALSDIVIGASIVLFFIHALVNINYHLGYGPRKERIISRCMSIVVKALNSTGLIISLFNLLGMALDHYLAIIRPLHYPSLFSGKQSYVFFIVAWCLAATLGFSDFFTGWMVTGAHARGYNYCEACYASTYQDDFALYVVTAITTVAMTFIYVRLYIKIKNYRTPGQVMQSAHARRSSTRLDIRRNKRALITTLLILGTFMLCWIPNCLLQVGLMIQISMDPSVVVDESWNYAMYHAGWYMYDLMLVNSVANPIIYAVRVFDVQLGYRRLMRKCCPRIKTLLHDEYIVRTNLMDCKTSSVKNRKNGVQVVGPAVAGRVKAGAVRHAWSLEQALVPPPGERESGSTSSNHNSHDVITQCCESAP